MRTYLSIDIDYWNSDRGSILGYRSTEETRVYRWLTKVFNLARYKGIPIKAVMNHQQLLDHVDGSKAQHLLNIDTHSDLADATTDVFNCGTWVSFVRWRQQGIYTWMHALGIEDGECNAEAPIFEEGTKPSFTDWGEINRRKVSHAKLPGAPAILKGVTEIGFVLSPAYADDHLQPIFYQLVAEHNLPYTKGRYDEDSFEIRSRRPPKLTPARRKKIQQAIRRHRWEE
jgi:hypothetical protein